MGILFTPLGFRVGRGAVSTQTCFLLSSAPGPLSLPRSELYLLPPDFLRAMLFPGLGTSEPETLLEGTIWEKLLVELSERSHLI